MAVVTKSPRQAPLAALKYRNFRLLWLGQLISVSGSMMQNAAILWHVSQLAPAAQKGLALGGVGLARLIPIMLLGLMSGVLADSLDRRKLMLFTQTAMLVTAGLLAVVTFGHWDNLWLIYGLSALGAALGLFDTPARQSLIPNLVPREHLPNAISLNTIMFQVASVLGPSLAGGVLAGLGLGWVYLFNAVSFVAVIVAIGLMRDIPARAEGPARPEISLAAAGEGLRFVFAAPLIRSTMLLDFFATFFASAMALLPIFVQDILKLSEASYGLLYAAPAVGALVGGLAMVPLANRLRHPGWVLLGAVLVYGLATVVFGFSTSFWLTYLCLALTGAADIVSVVIRNVIRQLSTPDHLRGRMVSVNMIFFQGGPQLGEMEAGLVAQALGAPISVITGGVGCLLATLWTAAATPELRNYRPAD